MGIPCSSKTVRMTLCSGSSLKVPVSEWGGRGDWTSQSGTGNGLSCQPVAPLHASHEEIKEEAHGLGGSYNRQEQHWQ